MLCLVNTARDASVALVVSQKVEQFLNAARIGNLDLFKKFVAQLDDVKGVLLPCIYLEREVRFSSLRLVLKLPSYFEAGSRPDGSELPSRECGIELPSKERTHFRRILLLRKGLTQTVADVKDANKRGALHFAAREGQTEVCKYLVVELKLDVDTKDEDGMI